MADNVIDLTSDSECDSDYAFKSATNVASAPSTHKETTASPTASSSASRQSKRKRKLDSLADPSESETSTPSELLGTDSLATNVVSMPADSLAANVASMPSDSLATNVVSMPSATWYFINVDNPDDASYFATNVPPCLYPLFSSIHGRCASDVVWEAKADTEREGVTLTVNQLLEGLGLQFADHSDPNLEADEREVIEELLDILSQYNKGDVRKELEGMSSGCSYAETLLEAHPGSKFVFYRSITIYK